MVFHLNVKCVPDQGQTSLCDQFHSACFTDDEIKAQPATLAVPEPHLVSDGESAADLTVLYQLL